MTLNVCRVLDARAPPVAQFALVFGGLSGFGLDFCDDPRVHAGNLPY